MYASSVVLANDTIVTVFSADSGPLDGQLQVLRWRVPPREVAGGNGFFSPAAVAVPFTDVGSGVDTAASSKGPSPPPPPATSGPPHVPIKIAWPWNVFEPRFQQWPARVKTFTGLDHETFSQPPLNIFQTAGGKIELLVQSNTGGQVLISQNGGGSFSPLCPKPPGPGRTASGVGILRDGTLLAATNQEECTYHHGAGGGLQCSFHTWMHRAEITRGSTGTATGCRWVDQYELQPLYEGDYVGANCALRFSQADDGTVYYMVENDRAPPSPNATLPPQQEYSFAVLYASTDSGKSFQYRGSPGRYTDENNILPVGEQGLLALTRYQDDAGMRSDTLGGPHYKQTAITRSTDAGRCDGPPFPCARTRVLSLCLKQVLDSGAHPDGVSSADSLARVARAQRNAARSVRKSAASRARVRPVSLTHKRTRGTRMDGPRTTCRHMMDGRSSAANASSRRWTGAQSKPGPHRRS